MHLNTFKMIMLKTLIQPVTPFQQNASIVFCSETKKCAIVDPGGDIELLLNIAKDNNLIPDKVLLTHGHIDHAGGATELSEILNIKIYGPHKADKFLLDELQKQGEMFGLPSKNCNPDSWLEEGDIIEIGNEILEIYFCPGHTPGHIIFFNKENKLALVGDVLFNGSIGRTDLPGGNFEELINSVKNKLWPLGKDVDFIPGHGPVSTFEAERKSNPFVSDQALGLS
jgi:glyoxylase-like metal-dependent hydrolase (beta-lactamase superfamily II)